MSKSFGNTLSDALPEYRVTSLAQPNRAAACFFLWFLEKESASFLKKRSKKL
jgi:hypothetical protein